MAQLPQQKANHIQDKDVENTKIEIHIPLGHTHVFSDRHKLLFHSPKN